MMLKARKGEKGIAIYDSSPKRAVDFNLDIKETTWEIIQAIKKYGQEGAVKKIMKLFDIDEQNAKEDIQIVLTNLKTLDIRLEDIPEKVIESKYAPRTVQFDITPRCNSRCIYCLSADLMAHGKDLPTEKILETIKKLNDLDMISFVVSGGEPFLRKDIFEIFDYAENLKVQTWVFTNALLIDDKTAKRLAAYKYLGVQISLDSSNPAHHDCQRGVPGGFEKTVAGIRNLIKYGKPPMVAITITPTNYEDLEETVSFLNKLGVKLLRISTVWLGAGRGEKNKDKVNLPLDKIKLLGKRIIEMNNQYKGTMNFSASPNMFDFTKNPELAGSAEIGCDAGKENLYITSNGDIFPCYVLAYSEFKAGNILNDDITEVWKNSKIFEMFRNMSVKDFDKCKNCKFVKDCEGGCRGSAYSYFKSLTAYDPVRCSYFNNPK